MAEQAQLNRCSLGLLADAGALQSLAGHRHAARWAAVGVHRMDEVLHGSAATEQIVPLTTPEEAEDLAADYRRLGLTLGRHPMALLCARFDKERVMRSDRLKDLRDGCHIAVAGLVMIRQRPDTASGVIFATLEDVAGITNIII